MYFASEMKMYFFLLLFFNFSSSRGLLFTPEVINQTFPKEKTVKHILLNGKWIQSLPKKKSPLLLNLSPSLPLQPFSIISAQTSLLKKSETQTTVLKITEFLHKCPTLPSVALGSGLRWDCRATNYTDRRACAPTHKIHISIRGLRFTCPNM